MAVDFQAEFNKHGKCFSRISWQTFFSLAFWRKLASKCEHNSLFVLAIMESFHSIHAPTPYDSLVHQPPPDCCLFCCGICCCIFFLIHFYLYIPYFSRTNKTKALSKMVANSLIIFFLVCHFQSVFIATHAKKQMQNNAMNK